MKKLLIAVIISLILFSCSPRISKTEKIYKQNTTDLNRWINEYEEGKITALDLQWLIQSQKDLNSFYIKNKRKINRK